MHSATEARRARGPRVNNITGGDLCNNIKFMLSKQQHMLNILKLLISVGERCSGFVCTVRRGSGWIKKCTDSL